VQKPSAAQGCRSLRPMLVDLLTACNNEATTSVNLTAHLLLQLLYGQDFADLQQHCRRPLARRQHLWSEGLLQQYAMSCSGLGKVLQDLGTYSAPLRDANQLKIMHRQLQCAALVMACSPRDAKDVLSRDVPDIRAHRAISEVRAMCDEMQRTPGASDSLLALSNKCQDVAAVLLQHFAPSEDGPPGTGGSGQQPRSSSGKHSGRQRHGHTAGLQASNMQRPQREKNRTRWQSSDRRDGQKHSATARVEIDTAVAENIVANYERKMDEKRMKRRLERRTGRCEKEVDMQELEAAEEELEREFALRERMRDASEQRQWQTVRWQGSDESMELHVHFASAEDNFRECIREMFTNVEEPAGEDIPEDKTAAGGGTREARSQPVQPCAPSEPTIMKSCVCM
jgi:hypothetical protein